MTIQAIGGDRTANGRVRWPRPITARQLTRHKISAAEYGIGKRNDDCKYDQQIPSWFMDNAEADTRGCLLI